MGKPLESDSGRLWLDGEELCYESKTHDSWRIRIADIRVLGEMTNQNGPFADDYFLCFVTDASGHWHEASFYADGFDTCLAALGERWEHDLGVGLCHSTDFASRILWPAHLGDQPMFEFTQEAPRGVWQQMRHAAFPRCAQALSESALAEANRAG
jgi:hypothetical protein